MSEQKFPPKVWVMNCPLGPVVFSERANGTEQYISREEHEALLAEAKAALNRIAALSRESAMEQAAAIAREALWLVGGDEQRACYPCKTADVCDDRARPPQGF